MNIDRYLPDLGKLNPKLAELAREYVAEQLAKGARNGARETGVELDPTVFNERITEFLNTYTIRLAGSVNDTITSRIRDAISAGMEFGQDYREMRTAVLAALGCTRDENGKIIADAGIKYRAEMIARTESDRASNAGRDMQLQEAGASIARWKANPGCCEFCSEMDGMEIPVGEKFAQRGDTLTVTDGEGNERSMRLDYSDTEYPPLHPNCLCLLEYDF